MSKINRRTVVTVGVAVVAFVLGGLLLGGDSDSDATGHEPTVAATEPTAWTCSMHPQIQLPKEGRCPICFMDLIPLEPGSSDGLAPTQIRMSETARQLARITTAPVVRAAASREIELVGKVAYDETSVAEVTARMGGRLEQLYADYIGVTVKQSDPIARIYSPELIAGQEELIQAGRMVTATSSSSGGVLESTAAGTLKAAREKLRLLGLTADQIARVEESGSVYEYVNVSAPIGGVVVARQALEGAYVKTGSRLYTLADLSRLWLIFEAYESDLPWLEIGQTVSYSSQSQPGETFAASVTFIDPTVDPTTRTIRVRAEVDNSDGRLKPDMYLRGTVQANLGPQDGQGLSDESSLLVPATAALITGERAIVYVDLSDDEGPMFEGREVALGPRAGEFYVVSSGLQENEAVVVNGAFKIDAELQIQAKPSMMSPDGGGAPSGHDHGHGTVMAATPSVAGPNNDISVLPEGPEAIAMLTPVYHAYFDVQMALAKDDHAAATESSSTLLESIKAVDMGAFSPEGHNRWMDLMERMMKSAEAVSGSADIAAARDQFLHLSNGAIDLHRSFGHAEEAAYYLTYCPMAFDNAGAYWLQREDIVWNSYWGATMLRCGEIRDTLEPGAAE